MRASGLRERTIYYVLSIEGRRGNSSNLSGGGIRLASLSALEERHV